LSDFQFGRSAATACTNLVFNITIITIYVYNKPRLKGGEGSCAGAAFDTTNIHCPSARYRGTAMVGAIVADISFESLSVGAIM
jgi:hypothetical protein